MTDKDAATFREEISTKTLAKLCGISARRVQQLAGEGVFQKTGHGKYRLENAGGAYKDYCVKSEMGRRLSAESAKEQYDIERARKLMLQNDKEEALLVSTPDATAAIDYIFGEVLSSLAGIAPRLSDDVAERRKIEGVVNDIFGQLSQKLAEAGSALQEGRDPLEAGKADNS
ncbi:MAG: hypothetical protein L3J67_11560 [Hyphomicrobiaceae bacterium]|nr:hypothetical protein [Hyphomicrobiaceae bacterium]